MIIAILAWIVTAGGCYLFLHRAISNFGDPIVFENMAVPFSASLLAVLVATDLVPADKLVLFALILLGFLAGARVASAFMGRAGLRRAILDTLMRFSKAEIYGVLVVTMLVTLVFMAMAIASGGLGDGRAEFNRAFRPLAVLRSGLFLFSLMLLLSPRLSVRQVTVWLCALILLSIAFSGKGVFVPIFYWAGLKFFVTRKKADLGTIAALGGVMLVGVAVMGFLAYDATNASAIFILIANRFWMYGDVYIYAYKLDALSLIRGQYDVSFLAYMLHPITSLVGVRGYEKPLGSMLMSQVINQNVLTGPNPQLPVLLDFFFPERLVMSISIAFMIGLSVFGIRAGGVRLAGSRSRYLALGGITAAVFCPAAGFVDTSQVVITLVSIVIVAGVCAVFEMCTGMRRRPAVVSDSTNSGDAPGITFQSS